MDEKSIAVTLALGLALALFVYRDKAALFWSIGDHRAKRVGMLQVQFVILVLILTAGYALTE